MQLIDIPHRCRASFKIAHIAAFLGDDQRAFELAGLSCVDAKVGRELHRAAHSLWDITERSVAEDRRVKRRKKVIRVRHNRPEIFLDQVGMLLHRLGKRTEDDPQLSQFLLESSRDGYAVEDRIDRHPSELLLFLQRDTQLLIHRQ